MSKSARFWRFWLIVIFIIAVVLRFYNPVGRSLWGDEAHSVFMSRAVSVEALAKDSHLPGYFLLLTGWQKIAGLGEYNLRLLSIIIGLFSLLALFVLVRQVLDARSALYASFLLAISPLALMHAQEIRMYGLLLLFSILSAWFFWKMLEQLSWRDALGYIFFSVFLCLTHIYGVLIIVAELTVLLARRLKGSLMLLVAQIVIGVAILPFYLPMLLRNLGPALSGTADMAYAVFPWHLKTFLVFFVLTLGETVAPLLFLPGFLLRFTRGLYCRMIKGERLGLREMFGA